MSQILKDLWKDKPVLIVVVVIIGVLIYLLWKSNQSAIVAPGATSKSGQPGTVGYYRDHQRRHQPFPIPTGGGQA